MIKIVEIEKRSDLLKFIHFKIRLYKGNKYAIPTLVLDELTTLSKSKNPSFDFCESQCFLAYKDGKVVGRICAIINHRANESTSVKNGRFGFFDFVDDIEVAGQLLEAAEKWVKERGCIAIQGPLGFTDMDQEGMLIEGFDQLGTMATLYNYPYYQVAMEKLGYVKDNDWIEFNFPIPKVLDPRFERMADIVAKKNDLRLVKFSSAKQLITGGWGHQIFRLINHSYSHLYGYSSLTEKQIDFYVKQYLPLARMELISIVADKHDKVVAVGVSMPSLSKPLQLCKGRMLPFGWLYMLLALKRRKVKMVDLMLIAVDPEYQNKGLTALIIFNIFKGMQSLGVVSAESNPEMEDNEKIQAQWADFERRQHKRRRCFIKHL